jgi:hypothetical protein
VTTVASQVAEATTARTAQTIRTTAGGANVSNNNLLEQLIQMQAQLLNTTTPQSIATA